MLVTIPAAFGLSKVMPVGLVSIIVLIASFIPIYVSLNYACNICAEKKICYNLKTQRLQKVLSLKTSRVLSFTKTFAHAFVSFNASCALSKFSLK